MESIDLASSEVKKGLERLDVAERYFVENFLTDDDRFKQVLSVLRERVPDLKVSDDQYRLFEVACLSLVSGRLLSKEQFVDEVSKIISCDETSAQYLTEFFLKCALLYYVPRRFSFEEPDAGFYRNYPAFSSRDCSSSTALVGAIDEDLVARFSKELLGINEAIEKISKYFDDGAAEVSEAIEGTIEVLNNKIRRISGLREIKLSTNRGKEEHEVPGGDMGNLEAKLKESANKGPAMAEEIEEQLDSYVQESQAIDNNKNGCLLMLAGLAIAFIFGVPFAMIFGSGGEAIVAFLSLPFAIAFPYILKAKRRIALRTKHKEILLSIAKFETFANRYLRDSAIHHTSSKLEQRAIDEEEKKMLNLLYARYIAEAAEIAGGLGEWQLIESGDLNNFDVKNVLPVTSLPKAIGIGTAKLKGKWDRIPTVPVNMSLGTDGGLFIGYEESMTTEVSNYVDNLITRILASFPPGIARLTLIDPVAMGQTFKSFVKLADSEPLLISGKVFCDKADIRKRLQELLSHVQIVIGQRLRDQYEDLKEYNENHAKSPEAYNFVIIKDFPVGFSQDEFDALKRIITNGPKCGVIPIILVKQGVDFPHGVKLEEFTERVPSKLILTANGCKHTEMEHWQFILPTPVKPEAQSVVLDVVASNAESGIHVTVPFKDLHTFNDCAESWKKETTAECIEVALGPAGAQGDQLLKLGVGMEVSMLIAGRSGSGKSNLMHVIITGLAMKYSPEELQFYLIDFKGGVEFKPYAIHKLPHARAIAIESEREFGISVLRNLEQEREKRNKAFSAKGVQEIGQFRALGEHMPRIVMIVDEFQDFFAYQDSLAEEARQLFDDLVRKGRSAGIHVILGSQSISGHKTLSSVTKNQIMLRIALQSSEADSRAILEDDNPAAQLLTRPGEAVYNNRGGAKDANRMFQVSRCSGEDLEKALAHIRKQADQLAASGELTTQEYKQVVFEGNELPELDRCQPLLDMLSADSPGSNIGFTAYLGEAIEIRPPLSIQFKPRGGSNLMIVCREEEKGAGLCLLAQLSILAEHRNASHPPKVFNFDLTELGADWADHAEAMRDWVGEDNFKVIEKRNAINNALVEIADEVNKRTNEEESADNRPIFLVIQGLHRVRDLRDVASNYRLDENSSGKLLEKILRDGSEVGVYTVVWVDTVRNARGCLVGDSFREFGYRISGISSESDSLALLGSPHAARISKPNRYLFYNEEHPSEVLLFRPYALPSLNQFESLLKA